MKCVKSVSSDNVDSKPSQKRVSLYWIKCIYLYRKQVARTTYMTMQVDMATLGAST